jgi:hypothetical protein
MNSITAAAWAYHPDEKREPKAFPAGKAWDEPVTLASVPADWPEPEGVRVFRDNERLMIVMLRLLRENLSFTVHAYFLFFGVVITFVGFLLSIGVDLAAPFEQAELTPFTRESILTGLMVLIFGCVGCFLGQKGLNQTRFIVDRSRFRVRHSLFSLSWGSCIALDDIEQIRTIRRTRRSTDSDTDRITETDRYGLQLTLRNGQVIQISSFPWYSRSPFLRMRFIEKTVGREVEQRLMIKGARGCPDNGMGASL